MVPGLIAVGAPGLVGVALASGFSAGSASILLPTLATTVIFVAFTLALSRRVGDNVLGELGFVYLALAVAYTVLPASMFLALDLDSDTGSVWGNLSRLLPAPSDLGLHLWRHALFVLGVAGGYLLVRGRGIPRPPKEAKRGANGVAIVVLMGTIIICILAITWLSAPVSDYIDHYTRFNHLSWLSLRFVYICLTLKTGGYFVLLTYLFRHYARHRMLTIGSILAIGAYEMTYSLGSRIEALTILLGAMCIYHYTVRPVRLRMGVLAFVAMAVLFSAVELLRVTGFDSAAAREAVSQEGVTPGSEFGAVFLTSFHLYTERAQGSLPEREWPMFFSEWIALVPFVDHARWHPQFWYARNYFPDAIVPPQSMGVIADSAIWGGEIDLLLRSLINGAFFAYVVRFFRRRETKWWAMVVYAYFYATCVMALKYSIFSQLAPLVHLIVPTILVVELARRLSGSARARMEVHLTGQQLREPGTRDQA